MAKGKEVAPTVELVDKFHDFLMGDDPPGGITLQKRRVK